MVVAFDLDKTIADSKTLPELQRELNDNPDLALDRNFMARVELLHAFKGGCVRATADGKLTNPQQMQANLNKICAGLNEGREDAQKLHFEVRCVDSCSVQHASSHMRWLCTALQGCSGGFHAASPTGTRRPCTSWEVCDAIRVTFKAPIQLPAPRCTLRQLEHCAA
jgi:hypothetical protein